ncbi:MAG: glutamate--tRNA ligase, partial [Cyclobacteriaceae bacterium]|nr:glutamate--tRNA ligase [Cyclobacteriaceae bacterium]
KSDTDLSPYLLESLKGENISCSAEKAAAICSIMKERITYPNDLWEQGKFFFIAPTTFDESIVSKKWNTQAVTVLFAYRDAVAATKQFDAAAAKETLENVTAQLNISIGKILPALRLSITGTGMGPDLMMIMEIIGKEEVVKRLSFALDTLKVNAG